MCRHISYPQLNLGGVGFFFFFVSFFWTKFGMQQLKYGNYSLMMFLFFSENMQTQKKSNVFGPLIYANPKFNCFRTY